MIYLGGFLSKKRDKREVCVFQGGPFFVLAKSRGEGFLR